MATKKLTRKQKIFVDEYVATGIGAQAAKKAYDIKPNDERTPISIASENLTKPYIQEEVNRRLTKEMVEEAHQSLVTAVRLDYFVFPKKMEDEEIIEHMKSQGIVTVNIRESDKGKLAFYSLPDGASRGKGVELYHKIQGTFAPDKHVNINIGATTPNPRLNGLVIKLNDKRNRK